MGKKSKGSRKGKKAWRANISSADIEDFFEKSTKDALSGGSLSAVPSDSLFVVDKSRGTAGYYTLISITLKSCLFHFAGFCSCSSIWVVFLVDFDISCIGSLMVIFAFDSCFPPNYSVVCFV